MVKILVLLSEGFAEGNTKNMVIGGIFRMLTEYPLKKEQKPDRI